VTPAASTEEIRTAYRALAQRLHPDHAGSGSPAERALADRRMREINESWQVLQDPARRRAYDDDRIGAARRRPTSTARPRGAPSSAPVPVDDDADLVDVMPPMTAVQAGLFRHLPWVVLVLVFGTIFVLSAYAGGGDDPAPDASTSSATAGDCVDVAAGPSTTIVPCDGPHELEIVQRVVLASDCPEGTEVRRLGRDGRYDCVVAG
jgi:curved DNA-binding protein CbpA